MRGDGLQAQPTISAAYASMDDMTTTHTLDVWNDKLHREGRARREWHQRWGPTFGMGSRPDSADSNRRPLRPPPELPVAGSNSKVLEPTAATLRYNAALVPGPMIPGRPPSIPSIRNDPDTRSKQSSAMSGTSVASIPAMGAFSTTSSAKARKQLLRERKESLQRQLAQVDALLNRTAPSTQLTVNSADWRPTTSSSVRSSRPPLGRAQPRESKSVDAVITKPSTAKPSTPQPLAPLCLPRARKTEAFQSRAGAALALPGSTLSGSLGF